jgi:hypothetical protein
VRQSSEQQTHTKSRESVIVKQRQIKYKINIKNVKYNAKVLTTIVSTFKRDGLLTFDVSFCTQNTFDLGFERQSAANFQTTEVRDFFFFLLLLLLQ